MSAHPTGVDSPGLAAPELAHQDHGDLAPLGTSAAHVVVAPASDDARRQPGVSGDQEEADRGDCAEFQSKRLATAQARAALLGSQARSVDGAAWLLRHAHGAIIGHVRGLGAREAAVRGFEAAREDVAELVQRLAGRQGGGRGDAA